MSDPAIRKALEAGRQAMCRARNYGCGGECNECRDGSAAAIAAFLRALPNLAALPVTDGLERVGIGARRSKALAAAVDRAAGGE